MLTVRQIERWWRGGGHERILSELSAGRVEATGEVKTLLVGPVSAAALAVIRLDELNQSAHPLASEFVHYIITHENAAGGWADAATTALCVRALSCSRGHGVVIDRGLSALAASQRPDSLWARTSGNRIAEGDLHVTAFIVVQLVNAGVRGAVRIEDALAAIDATDRAAEPGLMRLRSHAAHRMPRRCSAAVAERPGSDRERQLLIPAAA